MYGNLNLGDVSRALSIANGSKYQLPQGVNEALAKTGSSYQAPASAIQGASQQPPEWFGTAQKSAGLLGSGSGAPPVDRDGDGKAYPGLKDSPAANMVRKVVSAVASFYTGGLAGLATNVGGQVIGKNNPKLGSAVSTLGGGLGGGGGIGGGMR